MRIQSTIKPMSVSISAITVEGSNTQIYDTELQEYVPDYRLTPIVIALKAQKEEDGTVSEVTSFVDTLVYEQVDGEWVQRNSTSTFVINSSAGTITIKENTPINSSRKFKIDTKIADSRRPGIPTLVSEGADLHCKIMSDSPFQLIHDYLDGQGAYVLRPLDNYRIQEKMMKGTTEWIQTYFRWYRRINNVDTEITVDNANGITGLDSNTLSIPYVEIPDRGVSYKCVADPAVDMTGVNLVSKKMITDDWNAIAAGISTPGQDAGGKYFAINHQLLYTSISTSGGNDIFFGKIKYKTNQRYALSVSWKLQAIQSSNGMSLRMHYTDGTYDFISLHLSQITKEFRQIIAPEGKTVRSISSNYGSTGSATLIYDIQLVEYHGATNLITGGKRIGILTDDNGSAGDNYKAATKSIIGSFKKGDSITFRVGSIENVQGTAAWYSLLIGQKGITVSNMINTTTKGGVGVLTINKDLETGVPCALYLYAGVNGSTKGNKVIYHDVMIASGAYTSDTMPKYSPADGEFLPAIPDGAPKPPLSANAKNEITTLSRKYPANKNENPVQTYISNIPNSPDNVFGYRMDLNTPAGTVQRPELSYSCLWYKTPEGGARSLLTKGFNIMENYTERMELDAVVKQGLDDAKWAAKFNGIDQHIRYLGVISNSTPVKNKTYETTFRYDKKLSIRQEIFSHVRNDSSYLHRAVLSITQDDKILVLAIKNNAITDSTQQWYTSTKSIRVGQLYKVVVAFDTNGVLFKFIINGIDESFTKTEEPGGVGAVSGLYLNSTSNPSAITLLNFKYIHLNSQLLIHYDFQPLNGDRGNMLKNKNENGSALAGTNYPLTPINISNLDDPNPATGFFTTI